MKFFVTLPSRNERLCQTNRLMFYARVLRIGVMHKTKHHGPAVQRVDTTVYEISHYPMNGSAFPLAYDSSDGELILEQLGPVTSTGTSLCACTIFDIKSTGYLCPRG